MIPIKKKNKGGVRGPYLRTALEHFLKSARRQKKLYLNTNIDPDVIRVQIFQCLAG